MVEEVHTVWDNANNAAEDAGEAVPLFSGGTFEVVREVIESLSTFGGVGGSEGDVKVNGVEEPAQNFFAGCPLAVAPSKFVCCGGRLGGRRGQCCGRGDV